MEDLPKYFFHGLIFSTFQLGFALVWDYVIFMIFFPGMLSASLGLILVLLVGMIVIFGVVNSALARRFWDLNPKNTVPSNLGQGALILAMFLVFSPMYYFTMLLISPHNLVATVGLVVAVLVFDSLFLGYIGKYIAAEFEALEEGTEQLASVSARHKMCPHCNSYFICGPSDIASDGTVVCPNCGQYHIVPVDGPGLDYSGEDWGGQRDNW